ncbi:MAG TPA: bifunctional isocitrate dehydrogenase kinase/phosphatase [Gammaproteobacteria bacterium]|jgi:isocitrate dehydrogenase kinase/phosphatase|nr:bifunctional isocitrate dehydrogenase kinase/phosphatase [Gammaproteobacteria bacterium]|tara:strand:- start:6138 stop:7865 length:1728 start_codon:yes stop_codon:yes gene_type:complete
MSDKELIAECSQIIYDGFIRYNNYFHRITRRARTRFEQRDWKGHQNDIVDRVDLYEKSVRRIVLALRRTLGPQLTDKNLWHDIRGYFANRLNQVPDNDFIKTFFNSTTRRIFGTEGHDPELEFISSGPTDDLQLIMSLNIRRYPYWVSLQRIFETILDDFSFRVPYDDINLNATKISKKIKTYTNEKFSKDVEYLRFEFIDSFFYQAARAYLVGKLIHSEGESPIIIAFKNENRGISVDAVFLEEKEISLIFGYTRSYYFADPNSVIGTVHFLKSMLPKKPIDELYTVLGRLRQGKTERHRIFTEHLSKTKDKFVHADGEVGLVMIVFTLPSYNLVFKVIRDTFGAPKTISREDVISKYKLVSKHDRAGRLIDTQEFLNLKFPINRFSKELSKELLKNASISVRKENDNLILKRVYVERRVRPLNLYINEYSFEEAARAIIDYGEAIKDLAKTNIFPGDLLLKNFGVTQHNRIIFYDYDEVSLVTDCNFRDIPESNSIEDEMQADTWYYVGEHDIFPEEFIRFLSMNDELKAEFMKYHKDLLTSKYWRRIKNQHLKGQALLVIPYTSHLSQRKAF